MANAKTSNALIQQLLKAEEEAEQIVSKAKENRVKMLKDARFSAEEELKAFRAREEERFKTDVEQRLGQEDSLATSLAEKSKREVEALKQDYVSNKDGVISFIALKVLDVDVSLNEERREVLRSSEARGVLA